MRLAPVWVTFWVSRDFVPNRFFLPAADSVEETLLFLLDGQNKTLEELFFEVTEGVSKEDLSEAEPATEKEEEKA